MSENKGKNKKIRIKFYFIKEDLNYCLGSGSIIGDISLHKRNRKKMTAFKEFL